MKLHFVEELFATVGAAKHGHDALNVRNVFRKIPRREGDVAKKGGRAVVHGKVKGGGKQVEVCSQRPDSCETGGKFLPQRGGDSNASRPYPKLLSTICLTIYRWLLSSPRKTSTQSLMLDALPPSGGLAAHVKL